MDDHLVHDMAALIVGGVGWRGFHVDNPPLDIVSVLLSGHKVWFISPRGRTTLYAVNHFSTLPALIQYVYSGGDDIYWGVQHPGDSIYMPWSSGHAVLTIPTLGGSNWSALMGHMIQTNPAELSRRRQIVANCHLASASDEF